MRVLVHPANVPDQEGAKRLLNGVKAIFPRLSCIWAGQGYCGADFTALVYEKFNTTLLITSHPAKGAWLCQDQSPSTLLGPQIQPRRWVLERTFAWEGRNRRLAKDRDPGQVKLQ